MYYLEKQIIFNKFKFKKISFKYFSEYNYTIIKFKSLKIKEII